VIKNATVKRKKFTILKKTGGKKGKDNLRFGHDRDTPNRIFR